MMPKTFMLIAGEASGDLLAAELVAALREQSAILHPPSSPIFFGAGGTKMSAAGVELTFDLTQHAVIGLTDVLKNIFKFRRLFHQLFAFAIERQPDFIIGVDYGGFNLRFGQAIKKYVRDNPFSKWNPKIIQFVSPQVWASRPGRAKKLAADYDLLLCIFPFEKDWYARRVPQLRVEFVGHPMIGRSQKSEVRSQNTNSTPKILLLPGSRKSELQRHLPVMLGAVKLIREKIPDARVKMVLPNAGLVEMAKSLGADMEIQPGELPGELAECDVAIASTGTVTMECAFYGVPTVALYKTSALTYQIAKRIITVKSLTMPNLLAGDEVYPEFIQHAATAENISRATVALLQDPARREKIKTRLAEIISTLGEPGAARRAAEAILSLK